MEVKSKKTFLLYYDQSQIWNGLSDEQAGKLIKLLHGNSNSPPPKNDPLLEYAYNIIKNKIDNDYNLWLKKCKKNKANARERWGKTDDFSKRHDRLLAARQKATHTKKEWETMQSIFSCCPRCGGSGEPVKDHIIPLYQGGSDGIDNIQPLCRKCNSEKGSETIDYRPKGWGNAFGGSERLRTQKTPATYADNDNDNVF